jgi:CBS domain-containing protein
MTIVKHLLEAKGGKANYSVAPTDTVLQALKVMAEAQIGSVLVKEKDKIVGIFTERDYARKGELLGRSAKDTLVKDLMTGEMYTVTTDTSVEQCMALMQKHHIRHLPVVEKGQLVGLVSLTDVMNAALDDRESEIKGLENYILGTNFRT